jgi:hypothetical protein
MASLHKIIDSHHDSLVWQCWDCGWESFPVELDEIDESDGLPEHECRRSEKRSSDKTEVRTHSRKQRRAAS